MERCETRLLEAGVVCCDDCGAGSTLRSSFSVSDQRGQAFTIAGRAFVHIGHVEKRAFGLEVTCRDRMVSPASLGLLSFPMSMISQNKCHGQL